jgi:hypothetical protein
LSVHKGDGQIIVGLSVVTIIDTSTVIVVKDSIMLPLLSHEITPGSSSCTNRDASGGIAHAANVVVVNVSVIVVVVVAVLITIAFLLAIANVKGATLLLLYFSTTRPSVSRPNRTIWSWW